jgi:hypothetical protein
MISLKETEDNRLRAAAAAQVAHDALFTGDTATALSALAEAIAYLTDTQQKIGAQLTLEAPAKQIG